MVIWTPRARTDLKGIHDYIKQDSPFNAKSVTRMILDKTAPLSDLPEIGKPIKELKLPYIRELDAHPWRILYHLRNNNIYIIAVVHKRQILDTKSIPH